MKLVSFDLLPLNEIFVREGLLFRKLSSDSAATVGQMITGTYLFEDHYECIISNAEFKGLDILELGGLGELEMLDINFLKTKRVRELLQFNSEDIKELDELVFQRKLVNRSW